MYSMLIGLVQYRCGIDAGQVLHQADVQENRFENLGANTRGEQ